MLDKKELVKGSQPANALPGDMKSKIELIEPQIKSVLGKVCTSNSRR